MNLNKLKPCANCGKELFPRPHGSAYIIRVSQVMPNPRAINERLGMAQYFQGSMALAEVFLPSVEKEIMVLADEMEGGKWEEIFMCFPCAAGLFQHRKPLLEMLKKERRNEATEG